MAPLPQRVRDEHRELRERLSQYGDHLLAMAGSMETRSSLRYSIAVLGDTFAPSSTTQDSSH